MGKRIWTYRIRFEFYCMLVERFGPHRKWDTMYWPKDRKHEFESFCVNFARVIGASEKGGPRTQLAWAITMQEKVDGFVEVYFSNKVAALEAGFIDRAYLPDGFRAVFN
jgi:hypothetical protein